MVQRYKSRLAAGVAAAALALLLPAGALGQEDPGGQKLQSAQNEPFGWIGIVEGYNTIEETVTIGGRTYDMSGATLLTGRVVDGETGDERDRRIEVGNRVGMVVANGKPLRLREIWLLPHD